jgi:hypothetical protein
MTHHEDAETVSAEFKAKVALEAIKGHETGCGSGDQARAASDPDCGVEGARGARLSVKYGVTCFIIRNRVSYAGTECNAEEALRRKARADCET